MNVKFVNGTITRTSTLEGPILHVYGDSKVELGENAVIDGGGLYLGYNLVTVDDAEFSITETGLIKGLGKQYVTAGGLAYYVEDYAVSTNAESIFKMYSGEINGIVGGDAPIEILGECKISKIKTSADVNYYSSANIGTIEGGRLVLYQHLTNDIIVRKGYYSSTLDAGDGLFWEGYRKWCVVDGAVVATAAESLSEGFTEDDILHIKDGNNWSGYVNAKLNLNGYRYVVENEGRDLVIRAKVDSMTSNDLQAKLDEIAAAGTYTQSNPATITIPESGVVIDKQLYLKENCHAVLTGGNISFTGSAHPHAFLLMAESSLAFKNITIDFSDATGADCLACSYYGCCVIFDDGVEFKNVSADNTMGLCDLSENSNLIYKSGHFISMQNAIRVQGNVSIYNGIIESSGTAITAKSVSIEAGTVIGGDVVIDCETLGTTVKSQIKSTKKNACLVKVADTGEIRGGTFVGEGARMYISNFLCIELNAQTPMLELANTAHLAFNANDAAINSSIETLNNPSSTEDQRIKALIYLSHYKKTIISNWAERELNKDIITGITEDMFKYLFEFAGVPTNLKVYYNTESNSVQLRKKTLQELLEELSGSGTEDAPTDIPIEDPVGVTGPLNFDSLQAVLDGLGDDGKNNTITFDGGDININPGSRVTLVNIDFTETEKGGCINVYGTLVVDININIVNIIRFINVMPGGRVIWNGGGGTSTEIVIEINGGSVEYSGGDYSGGHYGFSNTGGTIHVSGGTISGGWSGGYTHAGGQTHISGGFIGGGYINRGNTTITGGTIGGTLSSGNGSGKWTVDNGAGGTLTVSGGTIGGDNGGTIGNGGDVYLDGGTHGITDIHVVRGGKIYINFELTVLLRIHINIADIVLGTPIIMGYDGYTLKENSLKNIEINLPEGYEWQYDSKTGAIIIVISAGIDDVVVDSSPIESIHNVYGHKLSRQQKGLNIIRRKDGTVEKVMVR